MVHVKQEELVTPTSDNDPDGAFTLHHGPSMKPDSCTSSSSSRKGKTFLDEFKKEVITIVKNQITPILNHEVEEPVE
jgi:hypothetical protein